MRGAFILVVVLLCAGCTSGTKFVGELGSTKFYSMHAGHLDGPNWTALVAVEDGKAKVLQIFGSGPILPALVGSGSRIAAAAVWGAALKSRDIDVSAGSGVSVTTNFRTGNKWPAKSHKKPPKKK